MTRRVGILLHGDRAGIGDRLVGAVATGDTLGEVRAVEAVALDEVLGPATTRLAEVCEVVVGVGIDPVPRYAARHDVARDALGEVPYWAVETWHGLPALHDALAELVGAHAATGRRVLLTAPDDLLRPLPPEHRVVLRDVAEAVHERTGARPTVAVDRSPAMAPVTPTAVTAITTLAEAHGVTTVVRCSLRPGDGPDTDVSAAAASVGIDLVDVSVDVETHVALLREVVRTMVAQAVDEPTP